MFVGSSVLTDSVALNNSALDFGVILLSFDDNICTFKPHWWGKIFRLRRLICALEACFLTCQMLMNRAGPRVTISIEDKQDRRRMMVAAQVWSLGIATTDVDAGPCLACGREKHLHTNLQTLTYHDSPRHVIARSLPLRCVCCLPYYAIRP